MFQQPPLQSLGRLEAEGPRRQGPEVTVHAPLVPQGPISLQGHDRTTDLSFRKVRLAELPTAAN
jgi:hypothetical protein